jgi:hypothetical protein
MQIFKFLFDLFLKPALLRINGIPHISFSVGHHLHLFEWLHSAACLSSVHCANDRVQYYGILRFTILLVGNQLQCGTEWSSVIHYKVQNKWKIQPKKFVKNVVDSGKRSRLGTRQKKFISKGISPRVKNCIKNMLHSVIFYRNYLG